MIEVIKHSLGLCGEPHANLLTFLLSGVGLSTSFNYIYFKFKSYDQDKS